MPSTITKSDFIRYLQCPRYAWLWKHKPELRGEFGDGGRFAAQGKEVELLARRLFPCGWEVEGVGEEAALQTRALMSKGVKVLYQATALTDRFLARADILIRDESGEKWHLYEVKSSTSLREDFLADLYFQWRAFHDARIPLASMNLILVNHDYVYDKKKGLELDKLFTVQNLTEERKAAELKWRAQMDEAQKVLIGKSEPAVLVLNKSLKHEMSKEMLDYYWAEIPEYSVYRIAYINPNQLIDLLSKGVKMIDQVPDDYFSGDRQTRQVRVTKSKEIFIDRERLKSELAKLTYPLYFLDYETIAPAIPIFSGNRPYQNIPFQYSLHVIEKPGAEPKHFDFLHTRKSDPIPPLLKSLQSHIGDHGTVLAWNASFERSCNDGMAVHHPKYQDFLKSVNARMYDLALIFKDIYVDYRFKGSISLKNVLPIIAPELSYLKLEVQNGEMAVQSITNLINRTWFGKSKIVKELKEYCELDTFAMVRIYQFLIGLKG